jgi:hypothetical protein
MGSTTNRGCIGRSGPRRRDRHGDLVDVPAGDRGRSAPGAPGVGRHGHAAPNGAPVTKALGARFSPSTPRLAILVDYGSGTGQGLVYAQLPRCRPQRAVRVRAVRAPGRDHRPARGPCRPDARHPKQAHLRGLVGHVDLGVVTDTTHSDRGLRRSACWVAPPSPVSSSGKAGTGSADAGGQSC